MNNSLKEQAHGEIERIFRILLPQSGLAVREEQITLCHAMLDTLRVFGGLPHRCQWVRDLDGVSYYNDSKATNVGAALAAIEGLGADIDGKLVLIAGGDGKGADFSALKAPVARFCRAVVLLGRDAERLAEALGDDVPLVRVKTLEDAVQ